jgi:hypothetical protein
MTDEEVAAEKKITVTDVKKQDDETHADFKDFVEEGLESISTPALAAVKARSAPAGFSPLLILAWAVVGLPLAWGVSITLMKALALVR